MENQIQYIFSNEGLETALTNVLSKFNLIKQPESQVRPPATRLEASKFLNISLPTLDKLISSNQIPGFNIGRQVRINWNELEAYISQQE